MSDDGLRPEREWETDDRVMFAQHCNDLLAALEWALTAECGEVYHKELRAMHARVEQMLASASQPTEVLRRVA